MNKERIVLMLGVAGLLFAGYLSSFKFFSDTCAFGESCPYFLGYPACYFGLAMYLAITTFALIRAYGLGEARQANTSILAVSGLGILFAGYFTFGELPTLFAEGLSAYVLGLPTCALGLIVYTAIFVLSWKIRAGGR